MFGIPMARLKGDSAPGADADIALQTDLFEREMENGRRELDKLMQKRGGRQITRPSHADLGADGVAAPTGSI
eukprot:2917496-Prymnesium_polylepis.1